MQISSTSTKPLRRGAHRLGLPLAALAAMAGCAAELELDADFIDADAEQYELRGGDISYEDPAVGRLYFTDQNGGSSLCTATLIDPTTILTAAHCIDYVTGPVNGRFVIDLDAYTGWEFGLVEGVSYGHEVGRHDVAVVRLASAVPGFLAEPFGFGYITGWNQAMTIYGYGCRSESGDSFTGKKQRWDVNYDGDTPRTCPGDSGGPWLVTTARGTRSVALVTSGRTKSPLSSWKQAWGRVSDHSWEIHRQMDIWAGRPPRERTPINYLPDPPESPVASLPPMPDFP